MNYTTRINFKQFLLNNNTEIINSTYFKDNEDFFFNYDIFIIYLINKKIIKKRIKSLIKDRYNRIPQGLCKTSSSELFRIYRII
jgi:hypothetical protein